MKETLREFQPHQINKTIGGAEDIFVPCNLNIFNEINPKHPKFFTLAVYVMLSHLTLQLFLSF